LPDMTAEVAWETMVKADKEHDYDDFQEVSLHNITTINPLTKCRRSGATQRLSSRAKILSILLIWSKDFVNSP
jgi:hypothetical protein